MALTISSHMQAQAGSLVAHYRAIVSATAAEDYAALRREQIKRNIRQRIQIALRTARTLPPEGRARTIRVHLRALQSYCKSVDKSFMFAEEAIACSHYGLGGLPEASATLFHSADPQSAIAICVTQQGSLLYRSGSSWAIYRHEGDINVPSLSQRT